MRVRLTHCQHQRQNTCTTPDIQCPARIQARTDQCAKYTAIGIDPLPGRGLTHGKITKMKYIR
jgi:hypothetical protein